MKKRLRISILTDNPSSWYVPYARKLKKRLASFGHDVKHVYKANRLRKGDVAFFLSCEKIVGRDVRARHPHNIVIHGSAVPKGRGWSPLSWSVLEGKSVLPVSLFEADDNVDHGNVYATKTFKLDGHELIDEIRAKEAAVIEELAVAFVLQYPPGRGTPQSGKATYYPRRTPDDCEFDPAQPLLKHFNLLRIVDNKRYPAHFKHKGQTYILRIHKKKD